MLSTDSEYVDDVAGEELERGLPGGGAGVEAGQRR